MPTESELTPFAADVYRRYRSGGKTYRQWLEPYNSNPGRLLSDALNVLNGEKEFSYKAVIAPSPSPITWKGVCEKPSKLNYKLSGPGRPVLLLPPDVFLAQNYLLRRLKFQIGTTYEELPSVLGVDKDSSILHPYRRDIRRAALRIGNLRRKNPGVVFVKSDISKFYPSIRIEVLNQKLKTLGACDESIQFCSRFFKREIDTSNIDTEDGIQDCEKFRVGVPLGLVLSPYLANLYVFDIDVEFEGQNYWRYVDDLLFWGQTKAEVTSLWQTYKDRLDLLGLSVHDMGSDKTRVIAKQKQFQFLGLSVSSRGFVHPMREKLLLFEYKVEEEVKSDKGLLRTLERMDNLATGFVGYYGRLLGKEDIRRLDRFFAGQVRLALSNAGLLVRNKTLPEIMSSCGIKSLQDRLDEGESAASFRSDAYSSQETDDLISAIMYRDD